MVSIVKSRQTFRAACIIVSLDYPDNTDSKLLRNVTIYKLKLRHIPQDQWLSTPLSQPHMSHM